MHSKKITRIIALILFILILNVSAVFIYAADYYHADSYSLTSTEEISITSEDDLIIFEPDSPVAGLIFYPGGKVEFSAYSSLMHVFAENNILCILVKMPLNLAVLDINKADKAMAMFPDIDTWYVGGHSLGGSVAAMYAAKNTDILSGLLLLGSYSTADLSATDMTVITVYGSFDEVMNRNNYEKYTDNLPDGYIEHIIVGGCHSYFGNYGLQKGDGTPTISREKQINETVSVFIDTINSNIKYT